MKRYVLLALLPIILLCLVVSLATADQEPLIISLATEDPIYYAEAGQEVIVRAGWAACNRGLTQAFINSASVLLEIQYEGQPYLEVAPPASEYWGPVEPFEGDIVWECAIASKGFWASDWKYSLGELQAGEYDVHFLLDSGHPIPDGVDYDGDGHPDLIDFHWEIAPKIIVE